jgi:hypothetical protein
MKLGAPTQFREAAQARAVKRLLPTSLSSDELMEIGEKIRERSMFMARVADTRILSDVHSWVSGLVEGETNPATVRWELKEKLKELDYRPAPGQQGTIRDLSTDQRLNLTIKTNIEMAQGYGQYAQGQDEIILDAYPAQELIRVVDSAVKRDWYARWEAAGGTISPGMPEGLPIEEGMQGRLIAAKDNEIWTKLGPFGLPYPPFDFNSGLTVQDVDRATAEELGIIEVGQAIEAQDRGFSDEGTEINVAEMSPAIQQELIANLPGDYKLSDGVLVKA